MTTRHARTIRDAMSDPQLFGHLFAGDSWTAWKAFLACLFGLSMDAGQAVIARQCTGRETLPTTQAREAALVIGRRGGKSRITALIAVFLACFKDYSTVLALGERGTVMLIASDRKQARVLKGYVAGLLKASPMLEAMLFRETADGIDLTNGISIEIHTASFRSVRGYTIVVGIVDEIAFLPTDDAANPDTELLNALRPAGATVPGFLLLMISSPYARRGELWKAHKEHFGKDGDPVLVWQADTRTMNPLVPEVVVTNAYQADEASASAEYGAQFRKDVEMFVSREVVEACTVPGCVELAPITGMAYTGFADPSGGSQDSMTLAVAHWEKDQAVLDCIREVRPPFPPDAVVEEFAATLKTYGLHSVTGDKYGGMWPAERFQKHGIEYIPSDLTKSDIYKELLPRLNSRSVSLLDHPRLVAQLCGLERRTARGGKDSVDHGPHAHDDVANAAAGCLVLTTRRAARVPFALIDTQYDPMSPDEVERRTNEELQWKREQGILVIQDALNKQGYYFPHD